MKRPFVSKDQIVRIAERYPTPFHLYDEAGGIAAVTTLLAEKDINIRNIGIIHNREFEEGILRIEFYQPEACERAKTVLEENSYRVHLPKN